MVLPGSVLVLCAIWVRTSLTHIARVTGSGFVVPLAPHARGEEMEKEFESDWKFESSAVLNVSPGARSMAIFLTSGD